MPPGSGLPPLPPAACLLRHSQLTPSPHPRTRTRAQEFDGATGALIASWKLPDGSAPIALAAHGARFLYVVHGRVDDTWSLFPSRLSKLDLEDRAADGTPALVWSVDVGSVGGLGVDGDGNVWVTRAKSITQHAASDGTTLWTVDVSSSLGFNTVVDVRVDENGWLYLLTSGWSTTGSVLVMHQYGPTFVQIGKVGDKGFPTAAAGGGRGCRRVGAAHVWLAARAARAAACADARAREQRAAAPRPADPPPPLPPLRPLRDPAAG